MRFACAFPCSMGWIGGVGVWVLVFEYSIRDFIETQTDVRCGGCVVVLGFVFSSVMGLGNALRRVLGVSQETPMSVDWVEPGAQAASTNGFRNGRVCCGVCVRLS